MVESCGTRVTAGSSYQVLGWMKHPQNHVGDGEMSSEDGPEEVMFERSGMKRQGGGDDGGSAGEETCSSRERYGMSHVWEKVW